MIDKKPQHHRTRVNNDIRIPKVLVIKDGKNIGEIPTDQAKRMAQDAGLDLVEVQPFARPPVCVIMDYGKYKFDQDKKEKKKPHVIKEKEIRFRYVIGDHDLETKINQTKKFLEQKHKVKLVVLFKRRENIHRNEGFNLLNKFLDALKDYCTDEVVPKQEGGNIICRLEPKK